ncbi:unnamed protein product [Paramecium primaurelia]|uniref:Enkurin domain-containing protein n=2 Tax=Paramecium TaxID=5884 RepID=A0A8S1UQG5_9CILI|nr:unnamed protein product [Paramecium primaurelia]CAD8166022.1 unnamed protein product [Paramecium pentaurelia]
MQQESIYNLIPKEYVPPPKEPMYRSAYPNGLVPTASTFNNHTTSRPKVNNINGDFDLVKGPHTHKGQSHSLGKPKGSYKPDATMFRMKNTGTMGSNQLPEIQSFKYPQSCKAAVPKKDEKPIHGLKSNKNFIVTNAVENILSAPKQITEEKAWTEKKDYGKVPDYLTKIQSSINNEYEIIRNMHMNEAEERDKQKYLMTLEEVERLKLGLKKKWESVNKEYQSITHIRMIDTVGLKRKKEQCEKELALLEKDIEKLNKNYVFIDTQK